MNELVLADDRALWLEHLCGDAVIARSIIRMAQDLGLEVVAEGVETQAQFALLDSFSCACFQGYLFAKPVVADEFEAWLRRSSALSGPDIQQ